MFILKHYLSQCFFLSSSSSNFLLAFVFRQCHHLHCLINSAQEINNYIFLFTQMWDKFTSLDLIITTGLDQGGFVPQSTTFLQIIFFHLRKSKDTRLVENMVWVKWSLNTSLSVIFQVNQQFHFPSSVNKWKLTSTCQNCELSISSTYCNCSADLINCSLNKFAGNANVQDISNLSKN